jgi:hypothetical protein
MIPEGGQRPASGIFLFTIPSTDFHVPVGDHIATAREGFAMRRLAARATVCVSVSVCVEADSDGRADKRFSFSFQGGRGV